MNIALSQIVNKKLIAKYDRLEYGPVEGIAYSPYSFEIQALLLEGHYFFSGLAVKWSLVRDINESHIEIDTAYDIKPASKLFKPYSLLSFTSKDPYRVIVDQSLNRLGYLYDVKFSTSSNKITHLEMIMGQTTRDRWHIPVEHIHRINFNQIMITNNASEYLRYYYHSSKSRKTPDKQTDFFTQFQSRLEAVWQQIAH